MPRVRPSLDGFHRAELGIAWCRCQVTGVPLAVRDIWNEIVN